MNATEFVLAIDDKDLTTFDRALAVLWWIGRDDPAIGMGSKEICDVLEHAGRPKQNASRLNAQLADDRRTTRAGNDCWRLHPNCRTELRSKYGGFAERRRSIDSSDSVLARELFIGTRGYIERVVHQINGSYDSGLFDCCAVMCRRLLETLLIEVYEKQGRAREIKGSDGHFFMFAGLLSHLESDSSLHLSRNALKGLRDFKTLGDLSAHNRRFNALTDDIDRVRDGLRVAAEELLHMSGLIASAAA
jgi:hypothetical protein